MVKNSLEYLNMGGALYNGFPKKVIDFITKIQLKDEKNWEKFTDVFGTGIDVPDKGWRGEYWGKTMRGACLVYAYTCDEELYDILENSVKKLMMKQELDGRISTYDRENEFSGWDMWGRKYVLVGLEYFYRICKTETMRQKVLSCAQAHADYILRYIGKGKIDITQTSNIYGALNSCSILDAFLQLYRLTGEVRYLEFGEHIISFGGTGLGSLITCVENDIKLSEYPTQKAYEMMSFFEGLLTYYECTGKEYYLDIVIRFFEKVQDTEQTIVGGIGWKHEHFYNSTTLQTEYSDNPMLETCVTVTWIRVLSRLLAITGNVKYADRIELAAYNALYGTINFKMLDQYCYEKKLMVSGLPFDSYSPLVQYYRGDRIGGFKEFSDGTHYGCCGCIGAAAVALFPLGAVMKTEKGIVVNYYIDGKAAIVLENGKTAILQISTSYPKNGDVFISVETERENSFDLVLRIPEWCEKAEVDVNGDKRSVSKGYFTIENIGNKTKIALHMEMPIKQILLNEKTAFKRGPLVLARDEYKEKRRIDFSRKEMLVRGENKMPKFQELPLEGDENYRCQVKTIDGDTILFSDYASCGKHWTSKFKLVSVWNNLN